MLNNSIPNGLGLPYRLINTQDEHGIIGDINSFNSFLYITALNAMYNMANYFNDSELSDGLINEYIPYAVGN